MVFNTLKVKLKASDIKPSGPAAPKGSPPDKKSIYQSRYNFGVNIGSCFVLEKFMFGSFFIDDTGSECDAIKAQVKANGIEKTRELLENHWNGFMSEQDWSFLQSSNVKAVRIPIGYWGVNKGEYTKGTPFSDIAKVYENTWEIYKKFISDAAQYNIGVLVDLHALPGGANTGDHSGVTIKEPGFWNEASNQILALDILRFVAEESKKFDNVVGLQIVNESVFSDDGKYQKRYYSAAISTIREVNESIPIVISDGWFPDQWVKWILEEEEKVGGSIGVVIDAHTYRCFSDSDKQKSPQQIIQDLNGDLLTNLSGTVDILTGEYSCVLDGSSWDKCNGENRNGLVCQYGQALSSLLSERSTAGSYFWTYKFEHGDGGEWGFKPMIECGSIVPPPKLSNFPSREDFDKILDEKYNSHVQYWDGQNPSERYEHDRYKDGFTTAWADSEEFAKENSFLGRVHAWTDSRKYEHTRHKGDSKHVWEWEEGFKTGLQEYKSILLQLNGH